MLHCGVQELLSNRKSTETGTLCDDCSISPKNAVKNGTFISSEKPLSDTKTKDPRLKVATQLKYAMAKKRCIEHDALRNRRGDNVENLQSNVPYIALLDPLDTEYAESALHSTRSGADDAYLRMKGNGKSIETIMSLGAAVYGKV